MQTDEVALDDINLPVFGGQQDEPMSSQQKDSLDDEKTDQRNCCPTISAASHMPLIRQNGSRGNVRNGSKAAIRLRKKKDRQTAALLCCDFAGEAVTGVNPVTSDGLG